MDIILDKQTNTDASIKIKLQEADYQPKVAEKLKEYGKKANLKGFRPGKVPPALIKKMYGKSIMVDEINHLLVDAVNNYIKENKLPIVGEPLPDTEKAENIDWDTQKEFEFSYNVGLVPEFAVDFNTLSLTANEVELSDTELQETITNLQKRYGESTQPDTTEEGDYIFGDLKQTDGELSKEKAYISLEEVKKEALPQFIGKAKGDTVSFAIQDTFTSADAVAHVAGVSHEEAENLTGNFEFIITEIDRTTPATMGQEFFDKILGKDAVKSEEEFLTKLREILQENYKQESERAVIQQIQKQLVDNTEIVLPDDFLKRWLMASNEKVTPEILEKEYDLYIRDLKWNLIKNKIADENDLKVEHEEVVAKTKDMIRQQFGSMGMGEISEEEMNTYANNFLKADKGKSYMNIFDQAFTDKVVNHIKSQAAVDTKKVSAEEFKNIRNEENK